MLNNFNTVGMVTRRSGLRWFREREGGVHGGGGVKASLARPEIAFSGGAFAFAGRRH